MSFGGQWRINIIPTGRLVRLLILRTILRMDWGYGVGMGVLMIRSLFLNRNFSVISVVLSHYEVGTKDPAHLSFRSKVAVPSHPSLRSGCSGRYALCALCG